MKKIRESNNPKRLFKRGDVVRYNDWVYTIDEVSFHHGEWHYDISDDESQEYISGVPESELEKVVKEKPTSRRKFKKGEKVMFDGYDYVVDDASFHHGEWRYTISNDEIQEWKTGISEDELSKMTFREANTMKKLNITKEAFEKSQYFKNKYGNLEYVSESGKLFKTSKGKLLKFKEGVFGDIGDAIDSGVTGVRKFFHGKPKFKKGDIVMLCLADFSPSKVHHGEEIEDVKWNGKCWEYKMGLDPFGNAQWWPEDRVAEDPEPDKGSEPYVPEKFPEFSKFKKFGRKFNEGAYHDKHYLTIRDYDKLPDEEKANYVEPMFGIGMVVNLTDKFYKNTDMYGRMEPKTGWRIKEARYMKRSKIWDYYIVNDDSLGDGFWAEEDWICDEYDESAKKKFGRKFMKEGVGDVAKDPAYVCPYCGGHNCGFEDADDSPLEGYFDGGTLNA